MTAIDEILRKPETLRELLDERGVEHYDRFDVTEWVGSDSEICHTSVTYSNGVTALVLRKCTTPEQAIAATLGNGTCHNVGDPSDFCCSECGTRMFTNTSDTYTMIDSLGNIIEQPSFCPNCGRRIVEVDA